MDEQLHLPVQSHSPGPNYPVHESNQPPASERVVKTRQPRTNLKGGVSVKRREAMKAYEYSQTEKGKAAQDRKIANRRHHTALRKAVKLAEAELGDARILGKPDGVLTELDGHAKAARANLDAYEQEKEARKAARRVDSDEKKRLRHEREKAYKRVYARKKAAEKRAEKSSGGESSRARDDDEDENEDDGDDGQGSEMEDEDAVALTGELEEDDRPIMGKQSGE